ncbi:MAG: hypothetical protein CW346_10930 [Bacillaceae bacterium]|nr:hypothetical protein [Bacillaceae bacterium]
MKRILFRFVLLILGLMAVAGCDQGTAAESLGYQAAEEKADCALPVSWIQYKGEKYTFVKVHSKEEIDFANIRSTRTYTGEGDGTLPGSEIFVDKKTGNLLIVDDTGPEEEWVEFTKSEKD